MADLREDGLSKDGKGEGGKGEGVKGQGGRSVFEVAYLGDLEHFYV